MTPSHAAHSSDSHCLRLVVTKSQVERAVRRTARHVGAALVAAGEGRPRCRSTRVRPIEGIGVELRFEWNGELRVSQVFKTWDALEAAAAGKHSELEGRGWQTA